MTMADVIVISSSERPSVYTPPPLSRPSDRSSNISSPCPSSPSLISPSELLSKTLTQSKYFGLQSVKDAPQGRQSNELKPNDCDGLTTRKGKVGAAIMKPKSKRQKHTYGSAGSFKATCRAEEKVSNLRRVRAKSGSKYVEPLDKALKGRIIKPRDPDTKDKSEDIVLLCSTVSERQDLSDRKCSQEGGGLLLEEAMKRRLDWTPQKDTSEPTIEVPGSPNLESAREPSTRGFESLVAAYNFNGVATSALRDHSQDTDNGGPTKKRRIQLVAAKTTSPSATSQHNGVSANDTKSSATLQQRKGKRMQEKKVNTLTARATARYAAIEIDSGTNTSGEPPVDNKPIQKRGSKRKGQDPDIEILSPDAALRALDEQNLIFGTCSQLAREDLPATSGDVQVLIHQSESSGHREHQWQPDESLSERSEPLSYFTGLRGLWSAAARDLDGSVVRTDASCTTHTPASSNTLSGGCPTSTGETPRRRRHKSFTTEAGNLYRANASTSNNKQTALQVEDDGFGGYVKSPQMPHYSGYTDAELCSQVAAYGFKQVRGRQKMIDLLQKCWKSKYGAAAAASAREAPETILPTAHTAKRHGEAEPGAKLQLKAPSKTKSRPGTGNRNRESPAVLSRKPVTRDKPKSDSLSSKVEEIEEWDGGRIPSHRQPYDTTIISLPVETESHRQSPCGLSMSANQSRRSSLPDLSLQITNAVHAQPRSLTLACTRPSWYEKMLMYDPIILEDFTAWLNTEGLGLVGEDREVSAGHVRDWCEGKGICCCWRKGDGL